MDRAVIPTTNLFERYGLRRIINASGTETTKGASPVCPEVIAAVAALVPHSVEMAELQSVACSVIARALGAEAGCVVNCTAAGISIAVAACMTGRDLARVEQLPDATGMKSAVVMQRGHVVTYGGYVTQNVRLAGARVVEIGAATECGAYHLRAALGPDTACALYVVSHHTVQSGLLDLATFCAVCHEKGVPVIVDAAAEPEPRTYLEAGADLVILSAQKRLAGLTAGVVAGRMELVRACMYQEKGIGRPMKVGKEGVIATIAALERWMSIDKARAAQELAARLGRAKERLAGIPGVRAALEVDSTTPTFSRLHLYVDPGQAGFSALELSQALWNRRPSIFVRNLMADVGLLQVDLRLIPDEIAALICDAVIEEARTLRNGPPRQQDKAANYLGPHPNLADAALASLERWPLPLKPDR